MGEREIRATKVLKAARESDSIGTYNRQSVAMVAALLTHEAPRAALLDALGHGDCVPRYDREECIVTEHVRLEGRAERAERERDEERERRIAAETESGRQEGKAWVEHSARMRVERERHALRADNDRLRETLRVIRGGPSPGESIGWEWGARHAGRALSADADADAGAVPEDLQLARDADAEPERDPYGVAGPCEPGPSRAEGDETTRTDEGCGGPGVPHPCGGCADCLGALSGADDGGGDDGRSRAVKAAASALNEFRFGEKHHDRTARAIDAALASGGVVTREDAERRLREVQSEADRRYGEDAARWEAIIRDLDPYCPYGCGTCPDCRALQVVERAGESDRA